MKKLLVLLIATHSCSIFAVDDYDDFILKPLYIAECIDINRIVEQYAETNVNETFIHVRHMGDVDTPEWLNQTGTPITWDVSSRTGYLPHPLPSLWSAYQRGFEDDGLSPKNAYQVNCTNFGFFINTFQFGHDNPIACPDGFPDCLGGPNITYSRDFNPPIKVWNNPSSELTLQTTMKLPTVHYNVPFSTGQVSMFYLAENVNDGFLFYGLIGLFESRAFSPPIGVERIANDGILAFTSSPLGNNDSTGSQIRYITKSPISDAHVNKFQWEGEKFFRVHVSYENFENILNDIGRSSDSAYDYRILSIGILMETSPPRLDGTGTADISMGGSFVDFNMYEAFDDLIYKNGFEVQL